MIAVPSTASTRLALGLRASKPQDQVLRNQTVGRRCSGAAAGAAIGRFDADQDIVGAGFGVFDDHVEITIVVENAGVDELELQIAFAAPAVFFNQPPVRKFRLRVLVEKFHVGVGRRRVEIKIILFNVFAVVALVTGETEEAFFQDRIFAVPQR